MKKLALAALALAPLTLAACGGDSAKCQEALDAYGTAQTTCDAADQAADPWFSEATCETADDDGYDNTEFYDCLIEKFSNTTVEEVCEVDGDGNPTAVIQFEDNTESADPPGCRDLYNATEG